MQPKYSSALTCWLSIGVCGPNDPSHLTYFSYGSYSIGFILAHFLFFDISIFAHFSGGRGSKIILCDGAKV